MDRTYLQFIALLVVCICTVECEVPTPNIKVFPNAQLVDAQFKRIITAQPNICPTTGVGYFCNADCKSLSFCSSGTLNSNFVMNCTGSTPYCNATTNKCVASISSCLVQDTTITTCAQTFTADLLDCRKYYYCQGDGYLYQYYCDSGFVFDMVQNICRAGIPCNNFGLTAPGLCAGKANNFVVVPGNATNYVLCITPPQLLSCPASYTYNSATQACQFNCIMGGRFVDPADSTKKSYYECVPMGNTFIVTNKQCSDNTIFESTNDGPATVCSLPA